MRSGRKNRTRCKERGRDGFFRNQKGIQEQGVFGIAGAKKQEEKFRIEKGIEKSKEFSGFQIHWGGNTARTKGKGGQRVKVEVKVEVFVTNKQNKEPCFIGCIPVREASCLTRGLPGEGRTKKRIRKEQRERRRLKNSQKFNRWNFFGNASGIKRN